jgi:hypothetical protein
MDEGVYLLKARVPLSLVVWAPAMLPSLKQARKELKKLIRTHTPKPPRFGDEDLPDYCVESFDSIIGAAASYTEEQELSVAVAGFKDGLIPCEVIRVLSDR